jgi:hypothetical protein
MSENDFLNYYPFHACSFKENDGVITVEYINPDPSFIDKYIFKKLARKPAKIDLDEIGSFLWPYFDGKHSVADIIKIGEEKFGAKIFPAEERISGFVMQMAETRLINLYEKKQV